jgi:hypothetical protein
LLYSGGQKHVIKLGLFIPGDIGGFAESKSLLPMADVAREQINDSPKYLRDYTLETKWFNTKVSFFATCASTCEMPAQNQLSIISYSKVDKF